MVDDDGLGCRRHLKHESLMTHLLLSAVYVCMEMWAQTMGVLATGSCHNLQDLHVGVSCQEIPARRPQHEGAREKGRLVLASPAESGLQSLDGSNTSSELLHQGEERGHQFSISNEADAKPARLELNRLQTNQWTLTMSSWKIVFLY